MYNAILDIAKDIIVIGWALMIILGSILLIVLIVIAIRCNRVVGKASSTVDLITQYVTLPFTYLAGLLSRDDTEEKPRTRTRTRKTS